MPGRNPYIRPVTAEKPDRKFMVKFIIEEEGREVFFEVDPEKIPYGRTGEPGSILDIALAADIDVEHACGGVCACSTCHVHVLEGEKSCPEATDDEEDMLDEARGVTSESRLSCQCVPNGTQDLVVRIPKWGRNLAKEGH